MLRNESGKANIGSTLIILVGSTITTTLVEPSWRSTYYYKPFKKCLIHNALLTGAAFFGLSAWDEYAKRNNKPEVKANKFKI